MNWDDTPDSSDKKLQEERACHQVHIPREDTKLRQNFGRFGMAVAPASGTRGMFPSPPSRLDRVRSGDSLCRNQSTTDEASGDHCQSTAKEGAAVTHDRAPNQGSNLANDTNDCNIRSTQLDLCKLSTLSLSAWRLLTILEKCRVEVLRAMRTSVEKAHQKHHVDKENPIFFDRFPGLSRPSSEPRSFGMARATRAATMLM